MKYELIEVEELPEECKNCPPDEDCGFCEVVRWKLSPADELRHKIDVERAYIRHAQKRIDKFIEIKQRKIERLECELAELLEKED